jgi:hypothetical protein
VLAVNRREAIARISAGTAVAVIGSQLTHVTAFADGGSASSGPVPPTGGNWVSIAVAPSEQQFTANLTLGATACPKGTVANARIDTKWDNFVITASPAPPLTSLTPSPTRTTYTPNTGTTPISFAATSLFQASPAGRGPNTKFVAGDAVSFDIHYRWVCRNATGAAVWTCRSYRYGFTLTTSGSNLVAGAITVTSLTPPADCNSQPPVAP